MGAAQLHSRSGCPRHSTPRASPPFPTLAPGLDRGETSIRTRSNQTRGIYSCAVRGPNPKRGKLGIGHSCNLFGVGCHHSPGPASTGGTALLNARCLGKRVASGRPGGCASHCPRRPVCSSRPAARRNFSFFNSFSSGSPFTTLLGTKAWARVAHWHLGCPSLRGRVFIRFMMWRPFSSSFFPSSFFPFCSL